MTRALALALALCGSGSAWADVYHFPDPPDVTVAPYGSDGNPGTKQCPVRTWAQGKAMLIKRGIYDTEFSAMLMPYSEQGPATPSEPPTPGCEPEKGVPVS